MFRFLFADKTILSGSIFFPPKYLSSMQNIFPALRYTVYLHVDNKTLKQFSPEMVKKLNNDPRFKIRTA